MAAAALRESSAEFGQRDRAERAIQLPVADAWEFGIPTDRFTLVAKFLHPVVNGGCLRAS